MKPVLYVGLVGIVFWVANAHPLFGFFDAISALSRVEAESFESSGNTLSSSSTYSEEEEDDDDTYDIIDELTNVGIDFDIIGFLGTIEEEIDVNNSTEAGSEDEEDDEDDVYDIDSFVDMSLDSGILDYLDMFEDESDLSDSIETQIERPSTSLASIKPTGQGTLNYNPDVSHPDSQGVSNSNSTQNNSAMKLNVEELLANGTNVKLIPTVPPSRLHAPYNDTVENSLIIALPDDLKDDVDD